MGGTTGEHNILTEVVELVKTDSTPSFGQLPTTRIAAVGGMLGNTPILCGGHEGFINMNYNSCISFQNSIWSISHSMNEYRASSIGVQINSTALWILGGYHWVESLNLLDNTEFIIHGQTKGVPGPILPSKMICGCAVKLSEREIFVIGGNIPHLSITRNDVWIYDPQNGFARKKGPSLKIPRFGQSCNTMTDGENTFIVVAGGFNLGSFITSKVLDSVEIYNTSDNTWYFGMYKKFFTTNFLKIST